MSIVDLIGGLVIFAPPFVICSFTGGFAGAIAAGGREDRTILQNAGIGLVGWGAAWILSTVFTGVAPEELSLSLLVLALAFSVGFAFVLDRRGRTHAL